MTLLFVIVALVVIAGIALVAVGKFGQLEQALPDRPPVLPEDVVIDRQVVDQLRFSIGFRGYRMEQVDDVLDRLGAIIDDQQRELIQLRMAQPASEPVAEAASADELQA